MLKDSILHNSTQMYVAPKIPKLILSIHFECDYRRLTHQATHQIPRQHSNYKKIKKLKKHLL